jgi:hypothetical protein
MKQHLLFTMVFCTIGLFAAAQVPSYEYVVFNKATRRTPVALPDFSVSLKSHLWPEKSTYKEPSKLFVISDIEGEYETLKQLLWKAGVMDQHFNWTFGKGHLVIIGDVFDRGNQVTEALWLIYLLEDKAKKAGGYVHYLLGNHELMNLNGDYRYVHPRYMELARQTGVAYDSIYREHTELGRWLRTKNVMEKIGNYLFLHGGVSHYINAQELPPDSINATARRYYGQRDDAIPNEQYLVFSDYGPMWYRGYYMEPKATEAQVDSTLRLFRVKKIITGHTPVERISAFYEGKVINVDVPHARGSSEGLLIERNRFYRVPLKGDTEGLEVN